MDELATKAGVLTSISFASGPYATYEDCISAMYDSAELSIALNTNQSHLCSEDELLLAEFRRLTTESTGREPTLTHLDSTWANIVIQELPGPEGQESDWEVTLIDWADMGWLPAWMQAVAISRNIGMFTGDPEAPVDFVEKSKAVKLVSRSFEEPFDELKKNFVELCRAGWSIM